MNIPVFDLHCDTAFALLDSTLRPRGNLKENTLHFDLTRAGAYPGYVQCFACFSSPLLEVDPERLFEAELRNIREQFAAYDAWIHPVGTAAQLRANAAEGRIGAVLTIEGPAGFGYDPGKLPYLYETGFRMTTLGWNECNPLTGSHAAGDGLTELGVEYVRRAQRLGMIVDVSHISDAGFYDIMDITTGPVVASHSNSRVVCAHSRNLTDEMFRLICDTGGIVGLNLFADFLGKGTDLDAVCDHVLHFLEIDPDCKHIALGGDLDGCDRLPVGFAGVQDYRSLAQVLADRGLTEQMITDIFWNNALGVMERCCM